MDIEYVFHLRDDIKYNGQDTYYGTLILNFLMRKNLQIQMQQHHMHIYYINKMHNKLMKESKFR